MVLQSEDYSNWGIVTRHQDEWYIDYIIQGSMTSPEENMEIADLRSTTCGKDGLLS